jgi:aminoglycoside phosphotransferase (APT) family kinase protein
MDATDREIAQMAEFAAGQFDGRIKPNTLRPLFKQAEGLRVADATTAYLIDGTSSRDDCVLIASARAYPDSMHQSASAAIQARWLLGSELGQRVCVPLLADRLNGRSFAVFGRLEGFSQNRYVRLAQKRHAAPAVLNWLSAVQRHTGIAATDLEQRYHVPLQNLIGDADIPPKVRSLAEASLKAVQAGRVQTRTCLQHGDFWCGNIMFERAAIAGLGPFLRRFKVIDWGGSSVDGYPGIDLVRFLLSAFGSRAISARCLASYCQAAGLSPADLSVSCLSALGRLAAELNEMPKSNFVAMVVAIEDFLDRTHALDDLRRLDAA